MKTARWRDWSCDIVVAASDSATVATAARVVGREMRRIGRAVSRFDEASEVCRIACSEETTHLVSPALAHSVRAALWAAEATDGLLDPTLGRALVSHGYDRTIDDVRRGAARGPRPARVDWRDIDLDGDVLSLPAGTLLDLGATAKALTADRAAARAAEAGTGPCLVAIGGDVAVAGPAYAWPIAVSELPGHPAEETVTTYAGGVATSSVLARRWSVEGADAHHLLDPRTRCPARSPWRTATVLASSCLAANVASAAAILRGAGACDWLEKRHLPARLVSTGGAITRTIAWPTEAAA